MSDERDEPEGRDTSDSDGERNAPDAPDEPLGDLAADVRERRGERPPEREGPLSDLAAEVDERRRRSDDDSFEAFESVEVDEIDGEQLWARLADEDGRTVGVAAPPEESADDRDVRTIPKDTCHGCPYFAAPPEVACTHEGTDILELVGTDRFRVADCPMVVDEETVGALDEALELADVGDVGDVESE